MSTNEKSKLILNEIEHYLQFDIMQRDYAEKRSSEKTNKYN